MREKEVAAPQSLQLLEAVPGNHLFLYPDAPLYSVAGLSAGFAGCFHIHRNNVLGQPVAIALHHLFPSESSMDVLEKSLDFVKQHLNREYLLLHLE